MEKGMYVKEIVRDRLVRGVFAVREAKKLQTKRGKPYWSLSLIDKTGQVEGRIWDPERDNIAQVTVGTLVEIQGEATEFDQKLQVAIRKFRELDQADLDASWFVPVGPRNIEDMVSELRGLCAAEFSYQPWREFVSAVLDDPEIERGFRVSPAAISVHQPYVGGLLEHTLNVAGICLGICMRYRLLDRQLLLAAALFHDIGKIRELECGIAMRYSQSGLLLGHILLGLEMLMPYLETSRLEEPLREHFKHLIITHHGELEYGSPRLPQTAEAFVLHYADNLDAKIAMCANQFEQDSQRPAWSQKVACLGRQLLLPERTPDNNKAFYEDRGVREDDYYAGKPLY